MGDYPGPSSATSAAGVSAGLREECREGLLAGGESDDSIEVWSGKGTEGSMEMNAGRSGSHEKGFQKEFEKVIKMKSRRQYRGMHPPN
jgi:hypothetical protein